MKMYYYRLLLLGLMFLGHLSLSGQILNTAPVFEGTVTNISDADRAVLDEQLSDYFVFTLDQDSLSAYMKGQVGEFEFELNVEGQYSWQVKMEENIQLGQTQVFFKNGAKMTEVDLGDKAIKFYEGKVTGVNDFSYVRFRGRGNVLCGTVFFEGVKYVMKPLSEYITGDASDKVVLSTESFSADWAADGGDEDDCEFPVLGIGLIIDYSTYVKYENSGSAAITYATSLVYDSWENVFFPPFGVDFYIQRIVIHETPSGLDFFEGDVHLGTQLNNFWLSRFECSSYGGNQSDPIDLLVMVHHELVQNRAAGDNILDQEDPTVPVCWVGVGADYTTLAHEIGHCFLGGGHVDPDVCNSQTNCAGGGYIMCLDMELGDCFHEDNQSDIQATFNTGCADIFLDPGLEENACPQCWIGVDMSANHGDPIVVACTGNNQVEVVMTICNNFCEPQTMDLVMKYGIDQLNILSGLDGFVDCTVPTASVERWCKDAVSFEPGECKEYAFTYELTELSDLNNISFIGTVGSSSSGMTGGSSVIIYNPIDANDVEEISGNISTLITNDDLPDNAGPCYSGAEQLEFRITDDLIIDQDYCFGNHSTIIVDPGVKIIIQDGAKLHLIQTDLLGCGNIWSGIEIEDGGSLYMHSSSIQNAENAITAFDGSQLELFYNTFIDNFRGLYIPPNTQGNDVNVWSFVGNTFSYENGPGMPALPGVPSGVIINDVSYIDIQGYENVANDAGLNTFLNLNNGIVSLRSSLTVSGCRFENILGKAVHVKDNSLMLNMFSYTGGKGTYGKDMKECTYGIVADRIHTDISSVSLDGSSYAVTVKNLISGMANVSNCKLDKVKAYGIKLSNNHLLAEGEIGDNIIVGSQDEAYVNAIEIDGLPYVQTNGWNIHDNNVWLGRYHIGIKSIGGGNDFIGNNTIKYIGNTEQLNYTGMSISGSADVTVTCNDITGAGSGAVQDGPGLAYIRKGIYAVNTPGMTLSCNEVDKVPVGVNFWGASLGTDLKGNLFNDHYMGLLMGRYFSAGGPNGDAFIGSQYEKGNRWPLLNSGNSGSNVGAKHLSGDLNVVSNSLFRVDEVANPNYEPSNENAAGILWFSNQIEPTFECEGTGNTLCPTTGFQGFTGGNSINLENNIAETGVKSEWYNDVMDWTTKRQLFTRLGKGQIAMDAGNDFTSFQSKSQQTAIGQFDEMKSGLSELFAMESSTEVTHVDNLQMIKSTLAELATLNNLIRLSSTESDSLEYVSQRISRLAMLQSLQQSMTNTASTTLSEIDNRKVNLVATNGMLESDMIYKTNEKVVNQIYLEFLEDGSGELTNDQTQTLFSIAEQCPLSGGNAVFEARSLLGLASERFVFDDNLICDQSGRRSKMREGALNQFFSIYPNPATDIIDLSYDLPNEGKAEITIQNRMGQILLIESLTNTKGNIRFELEALPAGMYFCTVKQKGQILYTEKFVVVK